jgi:hypothetical protein
VIIKIPAVTIAACINAETGVGPAIASGSQVYNGICADFPQAINMKAAAEIQYISKSVAPVIAVLKA